ncbi:MAG: CPBP family glutamic-type intramembrane protease [Acidimicrobiales bacterium]
MSGSPPAAWYPDPSGVGEHRYWDGTSWTPGVVIGGRVEERPMPWPPVGPVHPTATIARPTPPPPVDDDRVDLPPRAALYALAGFVVGLVAGVGLAVAAEALDLPGIVVLTLNLAGLWSGLLGAALLASRRYGTASLTRDYGLSVRPNDIGWGVLVALGARFAGGLALIPFVYISERLVDVNQGVFDDVDKADVGVFLVLAFFTVIGAPLVEELFFRGLLLRSLVGALGVNAAIAVQAGLFGLAHFNPLLGVANLSLITVITVAGVIFGVTAHRRGIGRSIVAHAAFNLVTVIVVAFLIFT